MDLTSFLTAPEEFPMALADNFAETLIDLWNGAVARAVDTITP